MAYVITELCTRKGDCVEVCPVDCIVPGPRVDANWPLFYIDPEACIDCGACAPVCPPTGRAVTCRSSSPAEVRADICSRPWPSRTGGQSPCNGVDVRGSAPGTRETDLLNPVNLVDKVYALWNRNPITVTREYLTSWGKESIPAQPNRPAY